MSDAIKMPPEFTANNCEIAAGLVQYRIDRCIEINGSRESAAKSGGMALGMYHLEMVVHALEQAAKEIRELSTFAAQARTKALDDAAKIAAKRDLEIADAITAIRNSPMSEAHTLSPGEVIRSYLDGCADFDASFDEHKLISGLREHGYSILPTSSIDGYKTEIVSLTTKQDLLRGDKAFFKDECERLEGQRDDAREELATLRAALEKAETALKAFGMSRKIFAGHQPYDIPNLPDSFGLEIIMATTDDGRCDFTLGQFRRAKAALTAIKETKR